MSDTVRQECEALFASPAFGALVRRRRLVVLRLFAISMACFFSLPLLSSAAPWLLQVKLGGSTTVGFWYNIAQYFIGGAIAWRYAVHLRQFDREAAALKTGLRQAQAPLPAATAAA